MALLPLLLSSLFFLLSFYTQTITTQACRSSCPGSPDHLTIRFPFGLNETANNRCSYPGFTVSCNSPNRTILTLPNSAQFTVQDINYHGMVITLDDPNSCIPGRFLDGSFNLSGSPFRAVADVYNNLSFFNCSPVMVRGLDSNVKRITCLSKPDHTIVVAQQEPSYLHELCNFIKTVTVPGLWWVSLEPTTSLMLEWVRPDCSSCELHDGTCGFKSNQSLEVGCFVVASKGHGLPQSARYGIIIGVAILGFLCLIALFFRNSGEVNAYTHQHHQPTTELSTSVAFQHAVIAPGLNGPTIESYPRTLLGESRRLPNPNDNTCPICLSEYQPKEALRTIPDCKHYFHADCIDEWLRMNTTCPLCRNSPESRSISPSTSFL
ncbi:hypothetical protein SLE2022_086880 [Rubroshorea leprosula]